MEERKVKGSVLLGYMKFIKNTWGQDGLDEFISNIEISQEINEGLWYDNDWSVKTLAWIAEVKGEEYLEISGKHTVKDLGDLAYIVRFMDISSILKRGSDNYKDAFSTGDFIIELGDKSAVIRITGSAVSDKYACRTWIGVFQGMLELTKAKGTVKETQCERDGHPHCEFLMEWDKPVDMDKKIDRLM